MGSLSWWSDNWFFAIQSAGIIGSLLFSAISFRNLRSEERTANLLTIKEQHDDLWMRILERPELIRILSAKTDLKANPVTEEEELFLILAIGHLNTSYRTLIQGTEPDDAVRRDIRWFFSLPIPSAVWEKIKVRQNPAFIEFVESCRS